jgi:hypothetical protein
MSGGFGGLPFGVGPFGGGLSEVASALVGGGARSLGAGFDFGTVFAGDAPPQARAKPAGFQNGLERESWLVRSLSRRPEWRNL